MKELLDIRKKIKSKKPCFVMQDSHKLGRLHQRWRKPRGLHSKIRRHKKGYKKRVTIGYGSPNAVRGFHKDGLRPIVVCSIKDLDNIDIKSEGVMISSVTGTKKRVEIVKISREKGITVLNIKDIEQYLRNVEDDLKKRKDIKSKKQEEKTKKKKEIEKKVQDQKKEELSEKISEEERKEEEKKNKDKLLTKKEI